MPKLPFLLSQYQLLKQTAQYLSTLDLFHLALTNSELHTLILKSSPVFNHLKNVALCDEKGLKARQEFRGIYALRPQDFVWGKVRKAHYDEEIEVRVWNLSCDATDGLPCQKCGINVCEECRYVPRVRETPAWRSRRRPHRDPAYQSHTVVCYCTACDEKVERNLSPFLISETCDCDQYTRWICLPCRVKENKEDGEYYRTRTKADWEEWKDDEMGEGMSLGDHVDRRAFWCPCGKRAPVNGNVRCAWCKRRHNLDTWMDEDPSDIPFFDNDPCYPKIAFDSYGNDIMYPPLDYTGPIFS